MDPIQYEIIRNRLLAVTEEMRIALQSVSGSPTVTEATDFFTGLYLPDGEFATMGFQVAHEAPPVGALIRHITAHRRTPRPGDMYIGNDPYVGALHQNDVQMAGPVFDGDRLVAWAGVMAHETDVGGMNFASWCPQATEVYQEGLRIPAVKLVDAGELRDDVLEMIVGASRLPAALGLDIRAFIATLNVATERLHGLFARYGSDLVAEVMRRMIDTTEVHARARLAELPDGQVHVRDFGMAEGLLMFVRLDDPDDVRRETCGRPICQDDELRLVDDDGHDVPDGEVGELCVRGPYTLRGYFRAPEHNARAFTPDGFYRSGDLMRRHPSGNYVVAGRKKDLINRGGEKISAEEVENLILAHPDVVNVACVPVPDEVLGERMCACVVTRPGTTLDLPALVEFLEAFEIAKHKLPERLEVFAELPLSPIGKVSKKELVRRMS